VASGIRRFAGTDAGSYGVLAPVFFVVKFSKEDFDAWRSNLVTEEVFRAFERLEAKAKSDWMAMSWGRGICDPVKLSDLRARAEVVEDFRTMQFEDIEEWLKDEK
jgi:hypothetical protein